ncbi:MAG: serine/threonine-protein kinase M1 [Geoglossum umbratile]|nr:MAG: serine/threonine-protein kinase M1 [Geoglossum umbratile]
MARRGGSSQYSGARNNANNENEPPQSTIAAQIVQNLSTKNGDPQPADRGSFQQLLVEILGAGSGQATESKVFEKDFNVNYRLVCVVTKAGLDVLLSQDPFITPENLLVQASNSISVIHLTIQKTPQILFFSPAPGNEGPNIFQPPLFILLLPKIFSLIGHPTANALQEKLIGLLSLLFEVTARSSDVWRQSSELLEYFRACISAVIRSLEPTDGVGETSPKFKVFLPPDETVLRTHLGDVPPVVISKPFQTSVTDPLQASLIALNLSSVLLSRIWNSRTQRSSISFTKIDYVWTLDSISHLWTTLERLRRTSVFSERLGNTCISILRLFRSHLCHSKSSNPKTTDDKATLILIRISADLLRWPRHGLTTVLENELCSVFVDILGLSEKSNATSEAIDGYLLPPTLELVADGGLTSLSQDMQLVLARLLSRQTCGRKGTFTTIINQSIALKDSILEERLHGLEVCEEPQLDDEARPHKRRRLSKGLEVKRELVTQLTTEVFGLLGSQLAADLDGLSMVARDCFVKLSSEDQCRAFELLGNLACAGAGTLSLQHQSEGIGTGTRCLICDTSSPASSEEALWDEGESKEVFLTLSSLIKTPECQRSTKPRIWAMLAVRRLMRHSNNLTYLELTKSYFGEWCLQSHCSSLRELRIAAGLVHLSALLGELLIFDSRTLPVFLKQSLKSEVLQENRIVALDFLRKVSDKNELSLQETCVLAWAQVA